MTPRERATPRILNGSRKRRISRGSGQSVPEINRLLKQFSQIQRMMKAVKAGAKKGRPPRMPFLGR
jgi:signal recognition particle subunit SRP54